MTPEQHAQHRLGLVLVTISSVAWSTAGFFTRLISTDIWTILLWRGVFGGLTILAYIVWQERAGTLRRFRAIGPLGLLLAALSTFGMMTYLPAMRLTSIANVTIMYATVPFMTAILARVWIGERISRSTALASLLALVGVAIMEGGATLDGNVLGDFLAFLMTASMAVMMVIIRRHREIEMLPAACLSAFLCGVLSLPLAEPIPSTRDFVLLAVFGSTQLSLGLALFMVGSRFIPAGLAALLGALETPLGPLWVFLAFGEVPATATIVGGALIAVAVLAHFARELTLTRR